jgi:hypothetical protein
MKNQIITRDARNELNQPVVRAKLPIEAHATMVTALTVELDRILAIRQRMERLRHKVLYGDASVEEREAYHVKFVAVWHQLPSDISALENILNTWTNKKQFQVLAGMVAGSFTNSGRLERDFWLNAVWLAITCQRTENGNPIGGEPVSAPLLAKAVIRLCQTQKFLPSPAEFYEAILAERESLEELLNQTSQGSLVSLAKIKPPSLPVSFTDEEMKKLEQSDYRAPDLAIQIAAGDFMAELSTTADRKAAILVAVSRRLGLPQKLENERRSEAERKLKIEHCLQLLLAGCEREDRGRKTSISLRPLSPDLTGGHFAMSTIQEAAEQALAIIESWPDDVARRRVLASIQQIGWWRKWWRAASVHAEEVDATILLLDS